MEESKRLVYAAGFAVITITLFSIPSGPPLVNIIAGFFPIILTYIIAIGMSQLKRPIPDQVAYGTPILLSVLLGLLGAVGDTTMFGQMETWYLAIANIIGGLGVMAFMTDFLMPSPLTSTPSHLKHHIQEVLRYVVDINEIVNRVYGHHTGADALLRKKVRFTMSHAQRLERLFAKKDFKSAHTIVYELYEELRRLFEQEVTIIGRPRLHGLDRDAHGGSRIIDVLINNDGEPVRRYIEALTHSLQNLNSELLGLRK